MSRLDCYRSADGRFAWRLLSGNHRTLAMSPGRYDELREAVTAARRLQSQVADAVVDLSSERGDEWRWQMRNAGEIVAVSAHSYGRRIECIAAAERARQAAPGATVSERGRSRRMAGPRPVEPAPLDTPEPRGSAADDHAAT